MLNKYLVPILLSILFFLIYSSHTINRHLSFNSNAFDLGIFTQITYLYSKDLTPFSSLKHMTLLADHFEAILILLSPIYKLFPDPITLLILQALFVSLSSIPIYLISLNLIKDVLISFLITLAYLTSQGLIAAINFDFHPSTLSVLPLSLLIYAWYFKKWRLYWITLTFSILFKEDIPIFIVGLGLFELFHNQRKIGILTTLYGIVSLYLIKFKFMPFFWRDSDASYINASILPLSNPMEMLLLFFIRPSIFIDQLFNSPIKIQTIYTLLSPFMFLPILSSFTWLEVFPYLFLRFSSNYIQMWGVEFHHNANLIPFLAVGAIFAIQKYKITHFPITILLTFFLITEGLAPNSMVWGTIQSPIHYHSNYQYINNFIKDFSNNESISAQSPIVPHLANRERVYLFPEISDADYIILDTSLYTYPMNLNELRSRILTLEKSKYWKVVKRVKSLIIFKRNF